MARTNSVRLTSLVALVVLSLAACSGPSKAEALDAIRAGVTEDGSCTLPLDVMKQLKMQYSSRGMCVPKEGASRAGACVEALAGAGFTTKLDASYMLGWPDEVAGASLRDVPAYDRRARSQLFESCYAMTDALREGRFVCAEVKADKVTRITKRDDTHVDAKYARAMTFAPSLAVIEKACGEVARPPAEGSTPLARGASGWTVGSGAPDGDAAAQR